MRAVAITGEAVFAAALLALAVAALAAALSIPGEGLAAPGALPVTAASVMVGAGVLNLLHALRRGVPPRPGPVPHRPWRTPVALVLTAALAAVLAPLGFLIAGTLFMLGTALVLGARPGVAVLTALGVVLAVWVVFRLVFEVLLPSGPIPEAAWLGHVDDLLRGRR